MRILFVGGGSIGHIAPCVAVWRALQEIDPREQAHFVCSAREEETRFLDEEGMEWTALAQRNIGLLKLPAALLRAHALLRRWKPDVIFTKGGGVTVPVGIAARLMGIPIVAHESDAVAGRATRLMKFLGATVCYGFAQADRSATVTGNPLRPGIDGGSRDEGLKITGLSGKRPILLVTGGSQGATALNEAVAKHCDELLSTMDIVHLTGEGKTGATTTHSGYWQRPFAYGELAHLYAIASLALSRSGAGAIGELAANGIPTILVPLEGVAHDHQMINARRAATQTGGCIVLPQAALDADLVTTVRNLCASPDVLAAMGLAMQTLVKRDAAQVLARIVLKQVLG